MKENILSIFIALSTMCSSGPGVDTGNLTGTYKAFKEEIRALFEGGWVDSKRYERILTLLKDSSFIEINSSFEGFDHVDFYGRWNVVNEEVVLFYDGVLDDKGTKAPFEGNTGPVQFEKVFSRCRILPRGDLEVSEPGFLDKQPLKKIHDN